LKKRGKNANINTISFLKCFFRVRIQKKGGDSIQGNKILPANKKYKDSLIRALFNNPEKALQLYSDITGKQYSDKTQVEMKSIEVEFLRNLRNDISFIIDGTLVVFIEHQATLNKNMPLRLLQYVLMFYSAFYKLGGVLYREKLIRLPMPKFYVLYNGKSSYPSTGTMRLSDAFMKDETYSDETSLELVVNVININHGKMPANLQANKELQGYAQFVEKVQTNENAGLELSEAIRRAVNECISAGILAEFFEKYRDEVESMFSLVYDEELALKYAKEEGIEVGMERGIGVGMERGIGVGMERGIGVGMDITYALIQALKENMPISEIAKRYNVPESRVEQLSYVL